MKHIRNKQNQEIVYAILLETFYLFLRRLWGWLKTDGSFQKRTVLVHQLSIDLSPKLLENERSKFEYEI